MSEQYDILIKQARLRSEPNDLMDIGISDGVIKKIGKGISGGGTTEIKARGNLVTEAYVNTHLHLCKVYTLMMMGDEAMKAYHGEDGNMGSAMTGIELATKVKENYDESWIIKNVRKSVAEAAIYGNLHIRAFADVDSKAKLEGIKALIRAREEFKGIVNLQVVAFAQDGVVREPGTEELMRQAMDLGADVVGGIPWIEYTQADIEEHIRFCYQLAEEYDKPVSMLIDDAGDPTFRSLEVMILESLKRGWQGRSLAHHCRAMALYHQPYLMKIIALLKKAEMGIVTDPQTGPLHVPIRTLLDNDVLLCLGQDDVSDAYYTFGRNNMLEVAFLSAHCTWMTARPDLEKFYDMITFKAAECIGRPDLKVAEGAPADLVVLDQPNVLEALRYHEAPEVVISAGKVVDADKMKALARDKEW